MVDDIFFLGEEAFKIVAVGDVANSNLENLGHVILKFNGETEPELPGDVCLEARPLPKLAPGLVIRIEEGKQE